MAKKHEFSKDDREIILKQSITFWDETTESQSPFFNQVNEYERLARCLLPEGLENIYAAYEDRSALVPADIYNNLNSLKAVIRATVFKKKPYFSLNVAGEQGLHDDRTEKAENVLQGIMDMEANGRGFPSEASRAIYQALYAGLSACYTQWTKKFVKEPVRNKDRTLATDKKTGRPIMRDRLVASYPETISLDIRRCRIDPAAAEVKDIRIVGYHSLAQFSQLRKLNKDPNTKYNFDEKELQESSFEHSKYFEHVKSETDRYDRKGEPNTDFGDKQIEIWSLRGLYRFEQPDGTLVFRDIIVEIGNRNILLKAVSNTLPIPSYQFFDFPAVDQQHGRMYPMGVVEPARDQFLEQFVKSNQSLDSADYNAHAALIADSSATQHLPDYIESGGDQIYKLDLQASGLTSVGQAMQYLVKPPLGQDTFQHGAVLARKVQQTMRLSDYTANADPATSETATGVVALVSGGQNLTEDLIENLTDTYFAPTAQKKLILWNFHNADKISQIALKDAGTITVDPGDIDLPFQVSVMTAISGSNPAQARRFVEVYPTLQQNPRYNQDVVEETMVDILDLPNANKLLNTSGHLQAIIDRESGALGYGIPQPVHELDNHQAHVEGHSEYLQAIESGELDQPGQEPAKPDLLVAHIEEHQQFIAQRQAALGNTKEMGGNVGNLSQPEGASFKPPATGATGSFTPSESRA